MSKKTKNVSGNANADAAPSTEEAKNEIVPGEDQAAPKAAGGDQFSAPEYIEKKNKTSAEQYQKDKKFTTAAAENAKYTVSYEPRMGDTEPRNTNTSRSKYRKRKKMIPVIALLGGVILLGAIILTSVVKKLSTPAVDNAEPTVMGSGAKPTPDDGLTIPTPEPEDGAINEPALVIMSGDKASGERYVFHCEDVSWTEARDRCEAAGGHLVTISNEEELNEIVTLAMINNCSYVWIGCHRENDELIWENGEQIDFYAWGKGEPSKFDKGDNVSEDYVMLWKHNGEWVYNDSRNDPLEDYSDMYSGKIGYVVEFDE